MNLNHSIVKNYRFLKQFLKQNKALILPSFFIIFIGQLVPTYTFWEIEKGLNRFKKDDIINEKIVLTTEQRYKPGGSNSRYLEIQLSNGKIYPVLVENQDKIEEIKIGSSIIKKAYTSDFWINNSINFKLRNLSNEKVFNRAFMFLVSIFGIYSMYSGSKKDKN